MERTSLCRELLYTDNDFHLDLGFKFSTQTMVLVLNLISRKSSLHRQFLYLKYINPNNDTLEIYFFFLYFFYCRGIFRHKLPCSVSLVSSVKITKLTNHIFHKTKRTQRTQRVHRTCRTRRASKNLMDKLSNTQTTCISNIFYIRHCLRCSPGSYLLEFVSL